MTQIKILTSTKYLALIKCFRRQERFANVHSKRKEVANDGQFVKTDTPTLFNSSSAKIRYYLFRVLNCGSNKKQLK
jgi:hypothetical protein